MAVGDTGLPTDRLIEISTAMANYYDKNPFDFILMCGDNIYENGNISLIKTHFEIPFKRLLDKNVTFRATLGNHDVDNVNKGLDEVLYPKFNMADFYYNFNRNNVAFFSINTN